MTEEEDAKYGALAAGISFVIILALVAGLGWYTGMWTQ